MYKICKTKCSTGDARRPGTHYKYQCNYDERRRKAELRRRKIIQKLQCEYRINTGELHEGIVENMIRDVEIFEKQKRMREKSKAERRLCFVRRLVQEEKYRRRGVRTLPVLRRRAKVTRQPVTPEIHEEDSTDSMEQQYSLPVFYPVVTVVTISNLCNGQGSTEESKSTNKSYFVFKKEPEPAKSDQEVGEIGRKQLQRPVVTRQLSAVNETQLECTPSSIMFNNCEPNKTYKQTYRITNVGLDIIHCRYVGIEMKDAVKEEGMPFRVEVCDNALLRPGLSFTSRIQLFSFSDIPEMHCYIIYETRRKRKPNHHGVLRIPVSSFPARSLVQVTPTVIRFPSVTWCIATGKHRYKYLKKSFRIRNSGGKDCTCFIASSSEDVISDDVTDDEINPIITELVNNVFEVFRFSQRYFIRVPAMSAVKIDVDFIPEYKGYHHHIAFVRFEGSHNCTEEKIELIGDIKKTPLRVEPTGIDLNTCVINSGVYEGVFRVYNDSNGAFPVRLKVPGSMKKHSLVFPSSPVIQPWSHQICSIRLFPRVTIPYDAWRYYKDDTKVLEFPVFIEPTGPNSCNLEKIKLYVFAILTDYSLQLQPAEIDFGVVNTLETVRTEITLTNHSMTELEYGFLQLPMGVRVEPNDGFGVILPKETIPLYLLYSPVLNPEDEEGKYIFQVKVTSIAELGGFGERLPTSESESTDVTIMNEDIIYNTEVSESPEEIVSFNESEEEDEEPCLIDPAEELKILEEKQNRIREYLRQKIKTSPTVKSEESVQVEEEEDWCGESARQRELNVIMCKAVLMKPFCQLSATVIQLPATPLSSYSITRFSVTGVNTHSGDLCNCGYRGKLKSPKRPSLEARFEFGTNSDLVSIVPRVGRIAEGETIPIAIIFKPELSDDEVRYQSRILKAELMYEEEMKSKEVTPPAQKPKTRKANNRQGTRLKKVEMESQDVNLAMMDLTPYDVFAGEKAVQQMIDPFCLTIKVTCTVRTLPCNRIQEREEYHTLVIIAPVIKPRFIFLGKCQEIRFGKVTVGDRARKILEIQNISLRRIAPRVSALNPHGPFMCTTGYRMNKVDPEHIWRHPITFAPRGENGKEEELFEIRCGATTISLTVNGEGITPKYTFNPNFQLCILDIAYDVVSEVEFSIENMGEAELNLQFAGESVKTSATFTCDFNALEASGSRKSELGLRKSDRRTSQTAKRRIIFTEEIPQEIGTRLKEDFVDDVCLPENLFGIAGLNSNDEITLAPNGKVILKIRCCPRKDERKGTASNINAYAIKYKVMLAKTTLLKEFVIIGTLNPYK